MLPCSAFDFQSSSKYVVCSIVGNSAEEGRSGLSIVFFVWYMAIVCFIGLVSTGADSLVARCFGWPSALALEFRFRCFPRHIFSVGATRRLTPHGAVIGAALSAFLLVLGGEMLFWCRAVQSLDRSGLFFRLCCHTFHLMLNVD